jgi:hypothetical protein
MNNITEDEVAKLSEDIRANGLPSATIQLEDDNVPFDESDESDDEYTVPVQAIKYRKHSSGKERSGFSMLYVDNQKLWNKLSKLNVERVHYLKLDLANKTLDASNSEDTSKLLRASNKSLQTDIRNIKLRYNIGIVFLCSLQFMALWLSNKTCAFSL